MNKQPQPPEFFKAFLRGEEPSSAEMATAPVLHRWCVVVEISNRAFLRGHVRGHPNLPNGEKVNTSPILWLDRNHRWCRTQSRVYKLEPHTIKLNESESW